MKKWGFSAFEFLMLAALLLVGLSACGVLGASEPTPPPDGNWSDPELGQRLEKIRGTNTPVPTPNVEATITAAVAAALAEQATATPIPSAQVLRGTTSWPTFTPSPTATSRQTAIPLSTLRGPK